MFSALKNVPYVKQHLQTFWHSCPERMNQNRTSEPCLTPCLSSLNDGKVCLCTVERRGRMMEGEWM